MEEYDLYKIAKHAFGHSFGLQHEYNDKYMSPFALKEDASTSSKSSLFTGKGIILLNLLQHTGFIKKMASETKLLIY